MRQTTVFLVLVFLANADLFAQAQQPCDPAAKDVWEIAFQFPKAGQIGRQLLLTPEALTDSVNLTPGYEEWMKDALKRDFIPAQLQGKLFSELVIYRNRCNNVAWPDFKLWQEPPKPQKAGSEKRHKTFKMKGQWWNRPW